MAHAIEPAPTGRAKCRGCGERIAAAELRFGERLPNPFADGEMTHWFHLDCAAFKRPERFLEPLEAGAGSVAASERLASLARAGLTHRRLPRINGAERASTGRAECRSCRQAIDKGAWRVSLVFYEDGRFASAGFIHAGCAQAYFETPDIVDRIRRFSPKLGEEDLSGLQGEIEGPGRPGPPATE